MKYYIYKNDNDEFTYTDIKPISKEYLEVENVPDMMFREGYESKLMANFETKEVWIEQLETEEHKVQVEIGKLKNILSSTDYKAIKYAEGCYTAEEYESTRILREECREKINILEGKI